MKLLLESGRYRVVDGEKMERWRRKLEKKEREARERRFGRVRAAMNV